MSNIKKGLVLGIYESKEDADLSFTATADCFLKNHDTIKKRIHLSQIYKKKGKCAVFYDVVDQFKHGIAIVNVGKKDEVEFDEIEGINLKKDNIRYAAYYGVNCLKKHVKEVKVEDFGDAMAAAEGATLAKFNFNELKTGDNFEEVAVVTSFEKDPSPQWKHGEIVATGQNIARRFMELPANILTPTEYAKQITDIFSKLDNVKVNVYDKKWIEDQKMGMFLSVAAGSTQPPKFVEIIYTPKASDKFDVALVGKGITHDTGGNSLKPPSSMPDMRADMGGSANVVSTIFNLASLKSNVNVIGVCPLTENMPGGNATKPSDVVTSRSGKKVQIDNTDAEGRLVLGDAIDYVQTMKQDIVHGIIELSTLTGAQAVALGDGASGCYSTSPSLTKFLVKSGEQTGDRMWPMPFYKIYRTHMTKSTMADINNIGFTRWAGSCQAAAFLRSFIKDKYSKKFVHLDIAGVMDNKNDGVPYLSSGFTGRPTRTVTLAIQNMCNL